MLNPYVALGGAAAIFFAGVAFDRTAPLIGANARIEHFKLSTKTWQGHAKANHDTALAYARRAGLSEGLRVKEGRAAIAAVNATAAACDARVARARAAASAIRSIVTQEPRYDASHCPVRELVDPGQLRDAISPQ